MNIAWMTNGDYRFLGCQYEKYMVFRHIEIFLWKWRIELYWEVKK